MGKGGGVLARGHYRQQGIYGGPCAEAGERSIRLLLCSHPGDGPGCGLGAVAVGRASCVNGTGRGEAEGEGEREGSETDEGCAAYSCFVICEHNLLLKQKTLVGAT